MYDRYRGLQEVKWGGLTCAGTRYKDVCALGIRVRQLEDTEGI
jgi:hypothetical protein